VLSKVKSEYEGKKVFGVTEESNGNGTLYHIILEDQKNWFHVDATSGGTLQMTEKFRKA